MERGTFEVKPGKLDDKYNPFWVKCTPGFSSGLIIVRFDGEANFRLLSTLAEAYGSPNPEIDFIKHVSQEALGRRPRGRWDDFTILTQALAVARNRVIEINKELRDYSWQIHTRQDLRRSREFIGLNRFEPDRR